MQLGQGRIRDYRSRIRVGRGVMKTAYTSIWAEAVKQKPPLNAEKANGDRPTDRQTDTSGYRVACTRLKTPSEVFRSWLIVEPPFHELV